MVYRWISGNSIIAEVFDRFNIETSDWVSRAGYWIKEALLDIKAIPVSLEQCKIVTANEYLIELPCSLNSLIGVEYNKIRLNTTAQIAKRKTNDGNTSGDLSYTLMNNGKLRIESEYMEHEYGEFTIYFKGLETEFDEDLNAEIPFVPDNHFAREAMAFYILIQILSRGYEHPIYSIIVNNHLANPKLIYYGVDGKGGLRKRAMIEIKSMNLDQREFISKRIRTFLHPNYHKFVDFRGKMQ